MSYDRFTIALQSKNEKQKHALQPFLQLSK